MSELSHIQRVVGQVLIPEARAAHAAPPPPQDESLPVALELYYTAFAMKPAHRQAGLFVAGRYAARMGLDRDQVEAFAYHRLNEVMSEEGR